ncbi:MAG: hypothetical protein ACLRMZ_09790 [Blautia marasmi]
MEPDHRTLRFCLCIRKRLEPGFSPWKADKIYGKDTDFSGGAGEYLQYFEHVILPEAEHALSFEVKDRGIVGIPWPAYLPYMPCIIRKSLEESEVFPDPSGLTAGRITH